ncbi:MAG TPA: phosphotransferase, partial [Polyangiaceae bacterium]
MLPASELSIAALERLVETTLGTRPPLVLEEILGGASVRRFFRIRSVPGGSAVAMFAPVQSHEIIRASEGARPWPFLEVRNLLESRGVRVPRLLGTACEDGLILMEDLGQTLAQHLVERPDHRESLYRTAVADLARAQRALDPLPADSIVRERAFDEELLRLEV